MKINIDLIKDFENAILSEIKGLKKNGFQFVTYEQWQNQNDKGTESESKSEYYKFLVDSFWNLKQRLIVAKPRKILYAKKFVRLPEYEDGLQQIEKEIINGDSLFPRLSRKIYNPDEQDGMLFDFGIYHLHLGTIPDSKYPYLVEGQTRILYCLFDNEFAYFLVIDKHGRWNDLDLLRIIKENFPKKLDNWEMKDTLFENLQISEQGRLQFRKNGINAPIELDGKFYMPPGGGFSLSGISFQSIRTFQKQESRLREIENILKDYFSNNKELEQKLNVPALSLSLQSLQPFVLIDNENKISVELELDKDKIYKILTYKE